MKEKQTRWSLHKVLSLVLALVMVLGMVPTSVFAVGETDTGFSNAKRFFVVSDGNPSGTELGNFVQLIDSEFAAKGIPSSDVLPIAYGAETSAEAGDIVIKTDNSLSAQGYNVEITSDRVTVTGGDAFGAYYGLLELLQMFEKSKTLSVQTVENAPLVEERSAYIDCGRIYYSPALLKALIKTLAWNKMNTLYLDFSNNNATRFFLDTMEVKVGEKTYNINDARPTDYLSEEDMKGILTTAKEYGVQIIPTFNSPGHIGGLYSLNNSLFVKGTASDYDSSCGKITLNIANADAYEFGQKVAQLYVDFFAANGCKSFNMATDEATLSGVAYDSTNATYVKYVNDLNTYIKGKGMTARMFNDGIKSADSGISNDIIVLYWTTQTPNTKALFDAGYKVVNFNCYAGLYYAYMGYINGAYVWNQNVEKIYNGWNPGVLSCEVPSWSSDEYAYTPNETLTYEEYQGKLLGANFAVWSDYAFRNNKDGTAIINADDKNVVEKIQVVGERSWRNTSTDSYATWKSNLTTAPGGINVSSYQIDATTLPDASDFTSVVPKVELTAADETTNVSVSIYAEEGQTLTLSVKKITSGYTFASEDVVSYDVKPSLDGEAYTGTGSVRVPIPAEWTDTGRIWAYIITNGKVEKASGAVADGQYRIDAPHFSEMGLVYADESGVTEIRSITVSEGGTKKITVKGDDLRGQVHDDALNKNTATVDVAYVGTTEKTVLGDKKTPTSGLSDVVLSDGKGNFLVRNGEQLSNTTDISKATKWTIKDNYNNSYAIKSVSGGYYLKCSDGTLSAGTTSSNNTWYYSDSNGFYAYSYSYGIYYYLVNDNGTWKVRSYYSSSSGNPGYLYTTKTETTAVNENTITFTGVSEGTTSVIIGTTKYIITVEKSIVSGNTIELPISIIDYRADGLLFDYDVNDGNELSSYAYSLVRTYKGDRYSDASTAIADTTLEFLTLGGHRKGQTTGSGSAWTQGPQYGGAARTGLVKSTLGADGNPVYTDATVAFVAKRLAAGAVNSGVYKTDNNWNDIIYNTFLKEGAERSVLSSTTTGFSEGFANTKSYANISNAYDLAWYLLNNLFVADSNMAEVTDNVKGGTYTLPIYGMGTDAYNKMILRQDTDGSYYLDCYVDEGQVIFDDVNKAIYNDDTTYTGGSKFFYPLVDKGYDAYLGDTTDMQTQTSEDTTNHWYPIGANGSFTLKGEAQFIYHESDNLFFTFSGDDDVYLFVNDVLALDIGGAHWPLEKTVNLNDVATQCNLKDGEIATFKFFYMERCSDASNFSIRTNIELAERDIDVEKNAYSDTNYTQKIENGAVVPNETVMAYDLVLINKGNTDMNQITFVDRSGDPFNGSVSFGYDVENPTIAEGGESENHSTVKLGSLNSFVLFRTDATGAEVSDSRKTFTTLKELSDEIAGMTLPGGQSLHVRFLTATLNVQKAQMGTFINNLTVTAVSGGQPLSDSAVHQIYSFNADDATKTYVVDFGLPLKITKIFSGTAQPYIVDKALTLNKAPTYGNVTIFGTGFNTELVYTFKDHVTMDGLDTFDLNTAYSFNENTVALTKTINIIPASNVYYEDSLATYKSGTGSAETAIWGMDGKEHSTVYQALEELGGKDNNVYGYDDAYSDSTQFSMGSAQKVTVTADMAAKWTSGSAWPTASFTFKGTGFDVISLTDNRSGAIIVDVYRGKEASGQMVRSYIVDNYYGYTYNDGKWVRTDDKNALYQIPVMKITGLDYSEYTAVVTVLYDKAFNQTGTDACSFWLDAIRIYDPMGKDVADYTQDGEGYPQYIKLRTEILKSADAEEKMALFIDGAEDADITLYKNYGPNNEVYLAKGQAISFKISANSNIASIQIGAKAPKGSATMKVTIDGQAIEPKAIETATEMYYAIGTATDAGKVITITNTGDNILSLTNVKVTYTKAQTAATTLAELTEEDQANAVNTVRALFAEPVVEPDPFQPSRLEASWTKNVRAGQKATLTVKASTDVESITVNGVAVTSYRTRTERKGWGWNATKVTYREFTYTVTAQTSGTYEICAVNAEGTASEPITATLTVRSGSWWNIFAKWF